MSKRSEIAYEIEKWLKDYNLCEVYGGVIKTTSGKKNIPIYSVGFSKRSNLDGEIEVWGEKFYRLIYQTRYLDFPNKNTVVFKDRNNLLNYIYEAFVKINRDKADMYLEN